FHRDRTPLEAAQDRFVEFDHPFVGRVALEKQRAEGVKLRCVGLSVEAPNAFPRHGTPVIDGDRAVATFSSGGHSPTLDHGIGLAYLPTELATIGRELTVELRGRRVPARVTKLPF